MSIGDHPTSANSHANGTTATSKGKAKIEGKAEAKLDTKLDSKSEAMATTPADTLAVHTIRTLGADLCQQFKGGHPGTVMGAAAIGVALFRHVMEFNPANDQWFARDREYAPSSLSP